MTEIKKISNVEYKLTDEVLTRKWLGVSAKKTRLLALSDWTQLSDANIPQNFKNLWRGWRQKLRAVKRSAYTDPDRAMEALNSLEQQIPEKLSTIALENTPVGPLIPNREMEEMKDDLTKYINDFMSTEVTPKTIKLDDINKLIDNKLETATALLIENFNTSVDKKLIEFERKNIKDVPIDLDDAVVKLQLTINQKHDAQIPAFNEELLSEAIDFLSINETHSTWPMLIIHANYEELSILLMAEKVIRDKTEWLRHACTVEKNRLDYLKKLRHITTLEKVLELAQEIDSI